jgi:hypothetical protein
LLAYIDNKDQSHGRPKKRVEIVIKGEILIIIIIIIIMALQPSLGSWPLFSVS